MDTERMIMELRRLSEKHKFDKVNTFETNWSLMCKDVADRLSELLELNRMLMGSYIKDSDDIDRMLRTIEGNQSREIERALDMYNYVCREKDELRLRVIELEHKLRDVGIKC